MKDIDGGTGWQSNEGPVDAHMELTQVQFTAIFMEKI